MPLRYLLDTSVLSQLIRTPGDHLKRKIAAVGEHRLCTSIIVACELRLGARKKRSELLGERVEQLLASLEILALEPPIDRIYAEVRDALEKVGKPTGANDYLIAAHAIARDCVLVSENDRELHRVPGLTVENWVRGARKSRP